MDGDVVVTGRTVADDLVALERDDGAFGVAGEPIHRMDEVLAADAPRALDVQVSCDPRGGWQVDALVDGRVVATRHCDDWHRVERVRRTLADTRSSDRPLAGAASATALAGRR